ncbi:ANR family transcriptional regulator [Serratia sp. CY81684]|uniref:ANR family transcriptional regulator n=1 Tax=Serratia sp. CY81684 TaxID=3383686 RepID=UPI003832DCB5|nr:hypothetical protein SMKC056_47890 [Serratia marcescens]
MSALSDERPLEMSGSLAHQAHLRAVMQQAAQFERDGLFDDAASYWQRGVELSARENERHWCEVRALLCQKKGLRGEDTYIR